MNNLFSVIYQIAFSVKACIELDEYVYYEAYVNNCFDDLPGTLSICFETKPKWNNDRLIEDKE